MTYMTSQRKEDNKMSKKSIWMLITLCSCTLMLTAKLLWNKKQDFRPHETVTLISTLCVALQIYTENCGALPPESLGLKALTVDNDVKGWRGPYLRSTNDLVDPWGLQLRYQIRGSRPKIISAGADRLFGTKDDIDENTRL